jgi:hypothetical protein
VRACAHLKPVRVGHVSVTVTSGMFYEVNRFKSVADTMRVGGNGPTYLRAGPAGEIVQPRVRLWNV